MRVFRQGAWPEESSPLVYSEGLVNLIYPVGQFFADQENCTGSLQIIQICELENRLLVAVPQTAWHRSLSKRLLPPGVLVRATLVEVQAAEGDQVDVAIDGVSLKLWVGFLKKSLRDAIEILEEFDVDYFFDDNESRRALPLAQALVDVSQEHFAFFSADGYGGPGFDETGLGEEMTAGAADAGLDGEPMTDLEVRVAKMENALSDIAQELRRQGPLKASTKRRASPKLTLKPKQTTQASSSGDFLPTDTKAMFPKLDAGVVAAALQAGVPLAHLESMQSLMA